MWGDTDPLTYCRPPPGTPDCRGPCQDCPDYCQPVQQSWCELEHTISTRLSDREDCRHNNKPNEPCEKVLIRVEKDVVTSNENCYQKDSELCGPQNCKFVNLTMNCHEKNSSVEVELLERECVICQPKLAETIEVIEVCEEVLTDDCATDPLSKTWRKICNTGKSEIISDGISFQFVTTEKTDISVADLVRGSIQPVDNLFSETLKKFLTTTQRTTTASSEEISEILNLLREPKRKEETTTKAGVSPEQSTRPSSIYFDPILNTRPLQHRLVQNISRPSFTESLNSQLQNQFETEKSQQKFETSNTLTSVTEVTTSAPETTKVFTIVPVSVATSTTTTTTTQTTTTVPTRKVSQTTPESRSTQSTTLATEKTTTTKTKLSPADFLKLCFISQIGCDFSQNEISSSTTTTTTTTSSPRPESTTERVERVTKISSERQEKLRQRLQLCFLSGICGDGEVQESLASEQKERLTTELPTSTSRRIDTEIQRKVQERARACFFQGKCN